MDDARKSRARDTSPIVHLATDSPLAGATLIVTRPTGSALPIVRRVERLGGRALRLPGLSLRSVNDTAAAMSQWRQASDWEDWIFTSPAAVRFAKRLAGALTLRDGARAFAIGRATARALARRGILAVAAPEDETSEGLLALPALADVRGRRVAIVGAAGGRGMLQTTLAERGAHVVDLHVYRRSAARLGRRHFAALQAARDPLVTLASSAQALAHMVDALPPDMRARVVGQGVVVSSLRLAELARSHGFREVTIARSAGPADLVDAATRSLGRHRI